MKLSVLAAEFKTHEPQNLALNTPSAQYPWVSPDHRATFRVVAPDAQKVQVRAGQFENMCGSV